MRVFPAEEYFFFYPCKVIQTEHIVSVNGSLEKKTNKNPNLLYYRPGRKFGMFQWLYLETRALQNHAVNNAWPTRC